MMKKREKIFVISLGCAKNLVDSEYIIGILKSKGSEFTSVMDSAEIVLINTCGFIQSAVTEAKETILEITELKKRGKIKRIVVVGCFVQRYGYKLKKEFPNVDAWLGTGQVRKVSDIMENSAKNMETPFHIGRPTFLENHKMPRANTYPFYSAYLKIAEGCSHKCTYCLIPGLRGPYRSRRPKSLVIEAEKMIANGIKEINLVAQDTTLYGRDFDGEECLETLLERLIELDGIQWIRLLYCNPIGISERLLDLIDSAPIICPYLDIPQQHINEKILTAMGRSMNDEKPLELIERIRARKRRISIRTTIMVGFPGESPEIFEELVEFVKSAQFDHLGSFVFSPEKGTRAARLTKTVDTREAEKRQETIMKIQADISREHNQSLIGLRVPVLIEGVCRETGLLLEGRMETMAPDIDGKVFINKGQGVEGEIMPVLIEEAHDYDLVGGIAS
jgi:ribosomal protein S12 methylthiotransferase